MSDHINLEFVNMVWSFLFQTKSVVFFIKTNTKFIGGLITDFLLQK